MSINNKIILIFIAVLAVNSATLFGMPVTIVEGGIPVASPQKLIEEGIRLGNAEMLRKAWSHYEDTLLLSGASPLGCLELGKIYYHLSLLGESTEDDFDTAEFFARQAVSDNPESPDAHRALGLVLAGRGAYLDAMEELTLALHLSPGNQLLICDLAALHLTLHQPKKTIELLEGKNHTNGWTYVVLAMAWMQQNQKGKAILNLLKAKKLGYSGYWVEEMLGRLAEESGLPLR
ncbi:MAG: hypothetical protein Kow0029_07760 [Candidatus Rifleibacteriota bacterium]